VQSRSRTRYLISLLGGMSSDTPTTPLDTLSIVDVALSSNTELWVYVIAEIAHACIE
jgi:hypothetical protein